MTSASPNGDEARPQSIESLIEALDWPRSAVGPRTSWPRLLREAVSLVLPAQAQIVMFWGPDYVAFYNDAYAPTIGEKHPRALGRPAVENWAELWDDLEPLLRRVRETGETVFAKDRPFYIERHGFGEEVFFDISYSPMRAEDGSVGGVMCIVSETTDRVRATRRAEQELERLAALFEQAPGFIALLEGPDHLFRLVNGAYRRLIGGRDPVGLSVREALPDIEGQGFYEKLDRVFATGRPHAEFGARVSFQPVAGEEPEIRIVDYVFQPIKDLSGRVTGVFTQGSDVTDRFEAVAALRETEERLRLTIEAAAIGTWDYDPVADRLSWDARCKALFGLPPEAEISFEGAFQAGLHPDDRESTLTAVASALDPAGSGGYDVEYRTIGLTDGVERWLAARGRALSTQGRVTRFIGTVMDITDRKRAEAALAESESALRAETGALEILNRTAAHVAAELELGRVLKRVVEAGVALTGAEAGVFHDDASLAGEGAPAASAGWGADALGRLARTLALGGEGADRRPGAVRCDDLASDGRFEGAGYAEAPPFRSYLAARVIGRSGEAGALCFAHRDPGAFDARAERLVLGLAAHAAVGVENARLFEAEQRLNRILENKVEERTRERDRIWNLSRDPFLVADVDGRWLSVSPAWTDILGWAPHELLGRTSEWMEHPDDRDATRARLGRLASGETILRYENRFRTRDGSYRWFSWTAVPEGGLIYGVARDVTAEKEAAAALREAEEALRQAQKMETVGALTGGVAHDFNNLLQIVTGNLEILARNLPEDAARLRRATENAMTGARRAATLTQRLLAFSRRQPLAPKRVDPNRLIAGMSELLQRTLGETIEVETRCAPDSWTTEADPHQLENAVLNLAINARDAMPGGGRLTISTVNKTLGQASGLDVAPGDYVLISVADTGVGMDAETLRRAFEPFFTTKEVGKGTGLGLSMVYGFVKQSGGHVDVRSEPGAGTVVKIYLPRHRGTVPVAEPHEEAAPARRSPADAEAADSPGPRRRETILVCEDDQDVRAYSAGALRELGYRVVEAPDGPSALRLMEQEQGGVDLLFSDVVLPAGMTGAELAERVRGRWPAVKVLFATGYARDAIVHDGRLDPGVELLTKPFAFEDLSARVRDILDGG